LTAARLKSGAPAARPDPPRGVAWPALAYGVLIAAFAAYYAAFIARTSFRIGPARYFPLLDDAMVSMRYARHLVQGHGFVWNLGDPPLEGFTNPLWTLVMAAVHLLPLPQYRMTLAVQAIGAAILLALLVTVFRLAIWLRPPAAAAPNAKSEPTGAGAPLVAMILAGGYGPLVYWTLEGMEVGLLALIVTIAAAALVTGRRLALAYALLGVGTFVRTDFLAVLLAFALAGALLDPGRRRAHLGLGLGIAIAAATLQTGARLLYFHDPLPNTYYLKLTGYPTGLRVARGAWVLLTTIARSNGLLLALPLAAIAFESGEARRRQLLLLTPLFAQAAYSVWVGGDAWEGTIPCNRYLAVATPLLFVAAARPIARLAAWLDPRARMGAAPALALAVGVALAVAPWRTTLMLAPLPYIEKDRDLTARALAARQLTRPDGSVAATGVGTIGYYSERRIVDLLGKCDRHVARLPMRRALDQNPLTYFLPGHLKWDYAWSIGELKPDLVAQLWEYPDEARAYLTDYVVVTTMVGGEPLQMAAKQGSARVVWP
jgi:hypothetical protein